MLIGVDMDGVLANFVESFLLYHNRVYGTSLRYSDIVHYDLNKVVGIQEEEFISRLTNFYRSPYFKTIEPVEGSFEGVRCLREVSDLAIITSRPSELYELTHAWVQHYFSGNFKGIHFADSFYGNGGKSKVEMCKDLGVLMLLEDHLDYAKSCAQQGIPVILFNQPWNQCEELPSSLQRVYSWKDIVERI